LNGNALIEFNLSGLTQPYSLDFLPYDWRTASACALSDELEGNFYTDNPRSSVILKSYRGHDRFIDWQEIYIGPRP
jgi:hypothetical protein